MNKPFKLKKTSDFNEEQLKLLNRMKSILDSNPEINVDEFFIAPYYVYDKPSKPFPLKWFTNMTSFSVYSEYKKQQDNEHPDSDTAINSTVNSIKFIKEFCSEKNITLKDYFYTYKLGVFPAVVMHYIENKVNAYVMFINENIVKELDYTLSDLQTLLEEKLFKLKKIRDLLAISQKHSELLRKIKFKIIN
jgi:gamma-glutamylcyclotransferase (GGCT)/AIG2-like uncharacterized protein YtfP